MPGLSGDEPQRYSRQIRLAGVGEAGQGRIRAARVLIVGVGGLGSPVALYLAAAGVGTIGLVDPDAVELSNLQRQIAHTACDIGRLKVDSARDRIAALNPEVRVEKWAMALDADNAGDLVGRYDVVVDALDSIGARFVLNDACAAAGKPFVHGAVLGWTGEAMTYVPGRGGPCYRCVFGGAEASGRGDCRGSGRAEDDGGVGLGEPGPFDPSRVGVLATVPAVIGSIEATEVLKLITGAGEPLVGRLLLWDGLKMRFDEVRVAADAECGACGGRCGWY
ncbi:MAG: HesA/MoeB/ThiF family protein [Firmicutes bacterium]|nr:HesA/MoeB/ThiF family protein [Bacillota bacterium]MDD4337977.1 HesA/MoeB/ThiF family protein [Bacillota bacterium]